MVTRKVKSHDAMAQGLSASAEGAVGVEKALGRRAGDQATPGWEAGRLARAAPSARIFAQVCGIVILEVWSCISILTRSIGAVMVRETAPASPPASRSLSGRYPS